MLQGGTFRGAESVADESEHGIGDVEIGIIDGAFEIQASRDPVPALVRNQPCQSLGRPDFQARQKTAMRGRLELKMVEYGFHISAVCNRPPPPPRHTGRRFHVVHLSPRLFG